MSDNPGLNVKLITGLGVAVAAAVSSVGLYFLLKKDEEEAEDAIRQRHPRHMTSRSNKRKVKIRSDAIGAVIGRHGLNVRAIEERTSTRITFEEDRLTGDKVAVIHGTDEAIAAAEEIISRIENEQPITFTDDFMVPISAVGGIIGRNGDVIKKLCQSTGAKITVARQPSSENPGMNPVSIKGTPEQIKKARKEIDEIVSRNVIQQAFKQARESSSTSANGNASYSNGSASVLQSPPRAVSPTSAESPKSETSTITNKSHTYTTEDWDIPLHEELIPNLDDGLHVFVSHVESPSKFWVQVYGPKSTALDKLSNDMTDYYEVNARKDRLTSIKVGDIVAANYTEVDESWYRVRVIEIEEKHPAEDSEIRVFYLDFGGDAIKKRKELCSLKHQFLTALSFQAVECSLYGVVTADEVEGPHQWSEESIQFFNKITHASEWTEILARPKGKIKIPESKTAAVQTLVELVDFKDRPNGEVNIAHLLINKGYAKSSLMNGTATTPVNGLSPRSSDPPSPPSNLSTPPDEFPYQPIVSDNSAQVTPTSPDK